MMPRPQTASLWKVQEASPWAGSPADWMGFRLDQHPDLDSRAGDGIRTHDVSLGKAAFYH